MSVFKSVLAAVLFSSAFAGAAHAQNPTFTAKLQAPAAQSRVIANNTMWNCAGDTCVAHPSHAVSVRACRLFVREAGARVTAYGTDQQQLSSEELARCNGEASTQQARN
jgi:hypothetical protein